MILELIEVEQVLKLVKDCCVLYIMLSHVLGHPYGTVY